MNSSQLQQQEMLALGILLLLAVHIAEAHNAVLHLKHGFAHLEGSSVKQGGRGMSREHFQRLIDHDRARMQRRLAVVDFPLSGNDDPLVTGSVFPGILSLSLSHTHTPLFPRMLLALIIWLSEFHIRKGRWNLCQHCIFWPFSKRPSDAKKTFFFGVCLCVCVHTCICVPLWNFFSIYLLSSFPSHVPLSDRMLR
jgi:hypothetical protein